MIGCGSKIEGSTYEGNGGVVKIEFKSGEGLCVYWPCHHYVLLLESGKSQHGL